MSDLFREFAIRSAPTQVDLINDFVEEAPLWAGMPMQAASNGTQNVYEVIESISGMQKLAGLDAPLPTVSTESTLGTTDLSVFGGSMVVGQDRAKRFGGADAYFAQNLKIILPEAAKNFEYATYYNELRPYAKSKGKELKAGGATVGKQYSMVCIKWVPGQTTGLYNPDGFGRGSVFESFWYNGGNLYNISTVPGEHVPGYGMFLKSHFGLQLAGRGYVSSIVNIDLTEDLGEASGFAALPTVNMIDDMIYSVRGGANTIIVTHPRVIGAIAYHKRALVSMSSGETSYPGILSNWQGVPMIGTYNLLDAAEAVVA